MTFYQHSPETIKIAVAPMLDWTDRHCRFFHRQFSKHILLYSEMVVADAVIRGDRKKLLTFSEKERPVALQLAGSNAETLAEAARIAADFGYDEINLNVGCPSDRVQAGAFGACLMYRPQDVADMIAAMKRAVALPITVKSRIGVDDQDPHSALEHFALPVMAAGVDALWIHARKAWLQGLSAKENREIPPLDYESVYRLKQQNPACFIGINGGISKIEAVKEHLLHVDGVMIGRAAYHNPFLLADLETCLYPRLGASLYTSLGESVQDQKNRMNEQSLIETMAAYSDAHRKAGGSIWHVARHMMGLFAHRPGAKYWRQILSERASLKDATGAVLLEAYQAIASLA